MRFIVAGAGILFMTVALAPGASLAETSYPWCAVYTDGYNNCSFESYEQCKLTATPGSGSSCQQNLQYKPPAPEPQQAAAPSTAPTAAAPARKRNTKSQ